jgi:hypothetical protein
METLKLGMELVGQKLNDLNTARRLLAGAGATNTAALAFGGDTVYLQVLVQLE